MASVSESHFVMDFPSRMLQKTMSDNERAARLLQFQEGGLKVKSVCSGIDAPGEALRVLSIALKEVCKKSAEFRDTRPQPGESDDTGDHDRWFLV